MTKFNPDNKEVLTYGEALSPVFKITDKADALQYKQAYVDFIQKMIDKNPQETSRTAEEIANENIGYWAGYGSQDDRKRIESLFECAHPIFGSVKENGIPTGKEAFECGNKNKTLSEIRS